MKEHQRTDRLVLITIILVLLVAIALLTYKAPRLVYEINSDQVLTELNQQDFLVSVDQAKEMEKDENVVFVDIRNSGEFFVKHIENAINVPKIKLLDEASMEMFEDDTKSFVLYGSNHRAAAGPWMVLKQLGIENIKILVGGYSNYQNFGKAFPDYYQDLGEVEKAQYDIQSEISRVSAKFAEMDKVSGDDSPKLNKTPVKNSTPIQIIPVEQKPAADEGC
jgi:rhodanese-related sulfurtransferase